MRMEARVAAQPDIMYDLREQEKVAENDEPLVIGEEVGQGQVQEESQIYLIAEVQN
jgi:hypothetical protein